MTSTHIRKSDIDTSIGIIKNSNYSIKTGELILADTSAGSFTITLPSNPSNDDTIQVVDNNSTFDTNNCILARNGETIMGLAEDMNLDVKNISMELIYNGSDWRLK
jgi:hypothetical protein